MVSTLQRALPIVGAALGRKLGVQVEVSGRNAFTDGERIVCQPLTLNDQNRN